MAENDKKDSLKLADAEKSAGEGDKLSPGNGAQFIEREKQAREKLRGVSSRKNIVGRDIPLGADILLSILIIILVIGAIVGAVFLFRFYSISYSEKQIEYLVKIEQENNFQGFNVGDSLYLSEKDSGNVLFMGKITATDSINNTVLLLVDVKYRTGDGYTNGDCRIAVGSRFTLFNEKAIHDVCVVELQEIRGK